MRVAIVGTGLQAQRRAPVLAQSKTDTLSLIVSGNAERGAQFAARFGSESSDDWRSALSRDDIDAVIICTPPNSHADMTIAALNAGKHVLCEKPLSRTLEEAERMITAAEAAGRVLKCGFNHRHHPAILQAKTLFDQGRFGKPMIGRCRYGLCGRPGYESEWRAKSELAAGGHLMELGIHGIDLFRWFFGEMAQVSSMTGAQYFPMAPLEDNGMALLRAQSGALLQIHSSLTEWKNLFSFELIGTEGYFMVDGLGASYGTEKLITGRRDFTAPFQDTITEYRGGDRSWHNEWEEFVAAIQEARQPIGDGRDGLEAMRIVLTAYESDRSNRTIDIGGSSA